jgi:hypothetical protein
VSAERYPDVRRVTLTLADLRRCTVLERARALAAAGVDERDANRLLVAVTRQNAPADMIERGVLMFYALAWQLERRLDPALTWDQVQTWDVAFDVRDAPDPIAEAEALASVEAAIATGLPPAEAGELTLAQVEAYGTVRKDAERRARGRRGRRR